ncbi:hypothetical protein M885DRAFT_613652 [Pelagophyceae sp. CCMP2097]|nr:hypothetical protein M885DRAFT_613652 [Pelagophyceae sp. CCMP2097]|mmetsp:Transcript_27734/g.93183  ORF Transcript_27734/g.93183 Transcript_27734/m.93183 type:complete len:415 (-) Transcript_27734:12-1256(-)
MPHLAAPAWYPNATLASGQLSLRVFLPDASSGFYRSSRFEWSSMVGDVKVQGHRIFGHDLWRANPHDSKWPESGVGFSSEFGCGDDGPICGGGWGAEGSDVSNGVLGFEAADDGETFLKIGVGKLLKGSSDGDVETYTFNAPYAFAEPPVWDVTVDASSVTMSHWATHGAFGYRLDKIVSVDGDFITLKTTLTNLGAESIKTPFYNHNFLSVDGFEIGKGYALQLPLKSAAYADAGTWAKPLAKVADVSLLHPGNVQVDVKAGIGSSRVKAIFERDDSAPASYFANFQAAGDEPVWCASVMTHAKPLFAYNLYAEATTLSPEPMVLLEIKPGASEEWTTRVRCGVGAGHAQGAEFYEPHKDEWVFAGIFAGFLALIALVAAKKQPRNDAAPKYEAAAGDEAVPGDEAAPGASPK